MSWFTGKKTDYILIYKIGSFSVFVHTPPWDFQHNMTCIWGTRSYFTVKFYDNIKTCYKEKKGIIV